MNFLKKIWKRQTDEQPTAEAVTSTDSTQDTTEAPTAASCEANPPQQEDTLAEQASYIRASLFFDEKWYKEHYGFGEYLDAAAHYLTKGWLENKDPSPLFSTQEYLELYPEVKNSGLNPLLHFERQGYADGLFHEQIEERRKALLAANPDCLGDMDGGLLRLRITNACNAKCRYCGVRLGFGEEKEHAMEPDWYYDLCRPLYESIAVELITGGDAFVAKESYNYMKFMCENYPSVTLMTESNGIAFTKRFQDLAADNLFSTHFSINASNADYFVQGCWEGQGGEKVYPVLMKNIRDYVERLRQDGKLCFAPDVSMVLNHDNVSDMLDFVRLGLSLHAKAITFYFDYTENDMTGEYFSRPEVFRPVLRQLLELERVLAGKLLLYCRLWIPGKEAEPMQQSVEACPISELQEKYADILKLAEGRSITKEHEERNAWRRKLGKRELSWDMDFSPSLALRKCNGEQVCAAPWKELDLYPDGRLDFCGWFQPTLNLHHFLHNGQVNWDDIINSYPYLAARKRILHGNFHGCQTVCPMNTCQSPITPVHQYGYERTLKH